MFVWTRACALNVRRVSVLDEDFGNRNEARVLKNEEVYRAITKRDTVNFRYEHKLLEFSSHLSFISLTLKSVYLSNKLLVLRNKEVLVTVE